MKNYFFILLLLSHNIFGMEQGCSNSIGNYVELKNDTWTNKQQETPQTIYQGVPGVYYYSNGLIPQPYKDTSKESLQDLPALLETRAKIKEYLKATDIKSLLDYKEELKEQLYCRPVSEHDEIVAQIDEIDYQLETTSLITYYNDCEVKRLQGDWIALNKREAQLEALLKNPDLSDRDRFQLKQEKDIIKKMLNKPSTLKLMALAEGHPKAVLRAWHIMQQQYKDGQIGNKTFKAAKSLYLERKDVHILEDSGVFYQSTLQKEEPILETVPLNDNQSELIHSDPRIHSGKLENTTDLVTTTPTNPDLFPAYFTADPDKDFPAYMKQVDGFINSLEQQVQAAEGTELQPLLEKELSVEEKELFAAYHKEIVDELVREGIINHESRPEKVARLFVRTLAHELHPAQLKKDAENIIQAGSDIAQALMTPINGVN